MKKNIAIIAVFAAFASLVGLAAFVETRPPQKDTKSLQLADVVVSTSVGGAPDEEIATDYYKTIIKYAETYPELRPAIRKALADDQITYAEYDKIDGAAEKLDSQIGAVQAHQQSDALRKHLAALVKEKP